MSTRHFAFGLSTFRVGLRVCADDHVAVEDALEVAGEPAEDAVVGDVEIDDPVSGKSGIIKDMLTQRDLVSK